MVNLLPRQHHRRPQVGRAIAVPTAVRVTVVLMRSTGEELDQRYGHLPLSDDPPGAAVAAGSNALLQIYNLALSVGVDQIVQSL